MRAQVGCKGDRASHALSQVSLCPVGQAVGQGSSRCGEATTGMRGRENERTDI